MSTPTAYTVTLAVSALLMGLIVGLTLRFFPPKKKSRRKILEERLSASIASRFQELGGFSCLSAERDSTSPGRHGTIISLGVTQIQDLNTSEPVGTGGPFSGRPNKDTNCF